MNLSFDPWIPVTHRSGKQIFISIEQVFLSGNEYVDFNVLPHERIALMRLLSCVAHAALDGPETLMDRVLIAQQLQEKVPGYLAIWRDHFELFHEATPFLQRPDIIKEAKAEKKGQPSQFETTPVTKLVFHLATGNNTTLFDHPAHDVAERILPPKQLALSLLTFQNFSPGGLIAQVEWDGKLTARSSSHAPCTPSAMIHTFVRMGNVLETISANLLAKETIRREYEHQGWGKPIWEWMPQTRKDIDAITNATKSYVGRLVPMTRFIRLLSQQEMLLGDGFTYPSFEAVSQEPSAAVIVDTKKNTRKLVRARTEQALWRELHSLAAYYHDRAGGALTLSTLPEDEPCDIWSGAFLTDKATIIDTVESVFSLPRNFRYQESLRRYREQIIFAENVAGRLRWAVETYREHNDGGWPGRLKLAGPKKSQLKARVAASATRLYWTALEQNRSDILQFVIADDDVYESAKLKWRTRVIKSAKEAYEIVCAPMTAREQRAFALGARRLWIKIGDDLGEDGSNHDNADETTDTDGEAE